MSRDKTNEQAIIGLIELLEDKGIIDAAERRALTERADAERVEEARRSIKRGDGPPEWARASGRGNGGAKP